ncbi:hypothetical protein O987_14060 [Comamonas testosteroni TK102]|uniref:Uncharacterized protein n=1 Tax=Comamonas testosteroni TK102 TaxID=1392005 RepID=A0A076PMG2_COMTE|nr:hypothetical protein [Comamonas testosteroni]AIJ46928.1 hypothetical protein O987_14060 [Comamonas testosteroni TK102]
MAWPSVLENLPLIGLQNRLADGKNRRPIPMAERAVWWLSTETPHCYY